MDEMGWGRGELEETGLTLTHRILDTGGESSVSDNRTLDFPLRRKRFSKAVVLSGRKRGFRYLRAYERCRVHGPVRIISGTGSF